MCEIRQRQGRNRKLTFRADAQRRWYRLRADSLRELDEWLEPYRRMWADRLDALQRHLDEMEDE